MGVGSALDEKYLILFEARRGRRRTTSSSRPSRCALSPQRLPAHRHGASRVLDGQRTIAYEPFAYAAVVPHGDKFFWVHDWTDDYREASLSREVGSPRDLREIAYDAASRWAVPTRSARTAPGTTASARGARGLDRIEARVRETSPDADAVEAAWRTFRDGAASRSSDAR